MVSDTIEFDMTFITGHDRSQLLLSPEAVDDYVGSDNPVRFIDAFVDGRNLAVAGFGGIEPKGRSARAMRFCGHLILYRQQSTYGPLNTPDRDKPSI